MSFLIRLHLTTRSEITTGLTRAKLCLTH